MIDFSDIYTYYIFIFGLLIGSFLNVVIYRMPRELSFSKGRSLCTFCGHQLHWYDLVPLFSYMFLGGKCRYCKEKISVQYPLVELLTAIIFTLVYSVCGYSFTSILLYAIVSLVVVGIFTDFLYHGTFDFSTLWVCALYFIYIVINNRSLIVSLNMVLSSFVYFIPIILVVAYVTFKAKKKYILAVLTILFIVGISFYGLLNYDFNMILTFNIVSAIANWFSISILIIATDYIMKKIIKSEKIKGYINTITSYIMFILFFVFIFNIQNQVFSIDSIIETLTLSFKNIIIVFVFTLVYKFMIEIFNSHDNDEEVLENDEEIIDRDENMFTEYIGDGDLFIIPFAGLILGFQNVFNFYYIIGFSVLCVYLIAFRKGFKYTIPLYPFIILSIFLLIPFTYNFI